MSERMKFVNKMHRYDKNENDKLYSACIFKLKKIPSYIYISLPFLPIKNHKSYIFKKILIQV